jgi:hypothetical protein
MTIDSGFLWRLEALDQRGLFSIDATETAFSTIQIRQIRNVVPEWFILWYKRLGAFLSWRILVLFSVDFSWHHNHLETLSNINSLGIERSLWSRLSAVSLRTLSKKVERNSRPFCYIFDIIYLRNFVTALLLLNILQCNWKTAFCLEIEMSILILDISLKVSNWAVWDKIFNDLVFQVV